jgi:hypothetical protein
MRRKSAIRRQAPCRRLCWLDRSGPPVRFKAVYGDRLLPLAHLQPKHLPAQGEDLVGWRWMPSFWHRVSQMAEVNFVPRSRVSCSCTLYLEIQQVMRVSAQVVAAMLCMGSASSQSEDLSTTVNRYLLPQVVAGRGPTISTWMWVNRLPGMAMGCTAAVCCLETLALSHCWQFLTHAATLLLRPRHMTLAAITACWPTCRHGLDHGRQRK